MIVTRTVPTSAQLSLERSKYPRCPAATAPMMSQMTMMTAPIDGPPLISTSTGDASVLYPERLISNVPHLPPVRRRVEPAANGRRFAELTEEHGIARQYE